MLSLIDKINFLEKNLLFKNNSYNDKIKSEIYEYFFELIGDKNDLKNFTFLNQFTSVETIEEKVDFLVSKVIMHEHEDGLYSIIEEYFYKSED